MHPQPRDSTERYTFRFDAPIEPRVFGDRYDLSGWLLHSDGEPITGIRAVLRRPLRRRQIFPARRKRSRPDIAAAFPHLPDAKNSGFLLELQLGLGRNHLTLQVRDEQRAWHTFHTAVISAYPLRLFHKLGFHHLRRFLISFLQRRYGGIPKLYAAQSRHPSLAPQPLEKQRVDLFATTKSNLFILEIGELIAAGFRELGCDARLLLDQLPTKNLSRDSVQIVVTPHEYYNLFLSDKVSAEEATELTKQVVLYCTEQPDTGWFYNNLPWAKKAKAVADINPLGVAAYKDRGIESYYFPLGYHDNLAAPDLTPYGDRPVDIAFLGSLTPRRDQFFAQHAPFFAEHRCHLRFVPLGFAKTKVTRSYLSPARRNELLSQSRLLLNVHYSERRYFEWHRALVGLANGCCVISESSEGYGNLIPGKHFVMADRDDLIACCDYYLAHPKEAEAIAQAGLSFIKTDSRQSQSCQCFLQMLTQDKQGTPSTVDVRHEPLPHALRRFLRKRRLLQLRTAITRDLRDLTSRSSKLTIVPNQSASFSRDLLIQKREAYSKRLAEQETDRNQGKQPWAYHDNEPYRSSTEPTLAVVVTLFNYAHFIRECLESVTKAAAFLSAPVEFVIVNDASTDSSLAEVLAYQQASKLAIRIVDKRYNTGLADARNVGVDIARAPYIFMMDADNLVFPDALSQLLAVISAGGHAAAYSMLCRFQGTVANRVGLLSYYDWDPQILVQQPYIDAMAMFRRDALLGTGSYDKTLNQIGWFGWEDYDMWLRFAQQNLKVAFVPNILCLYRYHETSMINVTNVFEPELVECFLKRYGDLVDQFEPREMLFGVLREKIPGLSAVLA